MVKINRQRLPEFRVTEWHNNDEHFYYVVDSNGDPIHTSVIRSRNVAANLADRWNRGDRRI